MGKLTTVLLVVIALLVGLYGGYWYEKNKWVAMSTTQVADYQKQINDLKMQQAAAPTVVMTAENTVYAMKSDVKLGSYLSDTKGMTLYIFDKDTKGVSNCIGNCAVTWPPYLATSVNAKLPENVTTINRADDVLQYAYKGMPLYYYKSDTKPGDVLGDGVGGVWHLAK